MQEWNEQKNEYTESAQEYAERGSEYFELPSEYPEIGAVTAKDTVGKAKKKSRICKTAGAGNSGAVEQVQH